MTLRRLFSKAYKTYKQAMDNAFNHNNLFYTNVVLSMGISTMGDVLEQSYEIHTKEIEKIDLSRTYRMAFSGCTAGIICHHCNNTMQALGMSWKRLALNIRNSRSVAHVKRAVKVAFSDKYLVYTNVTISVSISALGDSIEQSYELYIKEQDRFDLKRTLHMAFSGAAVGVLCHHWYKVLDRFLVGKTVDMVLKKLFLDQVLFSPAMILTFFGSLALLEDDPMENFKEEVRDKFVTLYRAEWMVWPPAQVINFYFLPTRFRVLYDNTISLGYDIYTSQVKHSKSFQSVSKEAMHGNKLS